MARGMKVEGAASSEEALSHLAGNSYDVVLCDFNLPGLSGEQLFERGWSRVGEQRPHTARLARTRGGHSPGLG